MLHRRPRVLLGLALALAGLAGAEHLFDRIRPVDPDLFLRHGTSRVILSRRGEWLRVTPTWRGERLIPLALERFSPALVAALLAAEDNRFRAHRGVCFGSVLRALLSNLAAGRVVSGASTLTMQLARILEPHPRSLTAKLGEMVRARQLERLLDKDRILELYLNLVPMGGTLRGFEAAARYWFGRSAADLGPVEAATLVAMLPAPSRRSPERNPELLRRCRNRVLDRMAECGRLDRREAERLGNLPLGARRHPWPWLAPHACDWLLGQAWGQRVETAIDMVLQRRWEEILRAHPPAGVDGLAALALDRASGRIQAMVGSRDYRQQQLNTCLCRRPAGSTLKPFLYALALDLGVAGPGTLLQDRPGRFHRYAPENATRDYAGPIRLGAALRRSRNLPAVRLLRAVGVGPFRRFLAGLGVDTGRAPLHLDLALGTLSVSPLELARGWRRLVAPGGGQGISLAARRIVVDALSRTSPDPALLPPGRVAWKTGTSSNRRDAWVVGHTGDRVVVVWLGNLDNHGSPGLMGATRAAPLFARLVAALPAADPAIVASLGSPTCPDNLAR